MFNTSGPTDTVTQLTYLPKVDDPRRDWVASVAVPAFLAHRAHNKVRNFVTVVTGAELGAIAATDIFDLGCLAITDRHQAVVDAAAENICNTSTGAGKFRLIAVLSPTGAVISSIGGRVPLAALLKMASEAGYRAKIVTYTWKIQSEPEEVVGGYKKNQEDGHGPLYFCPAKILRNTFGSLHPAVATRRTRAAETEESLLKHRIDASVVAYELNRNGLFIGHTAAIVRSTPL
ncbi:hypothetical protein DFH07DRAFT_855249 [Mycena maculata]|uniref:Uncharacterized protein n=1 Tax=Mycena maculata TaxID=230809 RepID=A0AAD7HMD9_9AGAR|nr:hypothetical protein DFH07DRAFT_855249 [Mycena maculata]